jgi:hypothetical protein
MNHTLIAIKWVVVDWILFYFILFYFTCLFICELCMCTCTSTCLPMSMYDSYDMGGGDWGTSREQIQSTFCF